MRTCVWAIGCAVAVFAVIAPVHAQSTRRPDLNIFGTGLRNPEQSVAVRSNLGVTFYDRLTALPGDDPQPTPDHGWGAFGSAALVYNLRLANTTFDGTVGSYASYYPGQPQPFRSKVFPGAGARWSWSWPVSDRTQVNASAGLRYRPAYAEAIFSGGGGAGRGIFGSSGGGRFAGGADANDAFLPRESAFVDGTYLTFDPGVSLRHTFSRRWSGSVDYQYQQNKAFNVDPERSLRSARRHSGRAALHFAVTRNLSVRGGYRYQESYFGAGREPYRIQGFDFGVDYGRGLVLQLARRTSLAMTGGVSAYVDSRERQRYRLNADVDLTHEFQRTWTSSLSYRRGISADEIIFGEPVLTDALRADVNGLMTRRLGAHASAMVQGGALAFGDAGRSRTVRSVSRAGIQMALTSYVALGVDYALYYYRFDESIRRPAGLPARSASQGVYAYLSAWAPVFQRGGRTNAAR